MLNFNVEPLDLILGSLDFEVGVHGKAASSCCPRLGSYVLSCVAKQVEIGKEGVFYYFFPVKLRFLEERGGGIESIEGVSY
jgi:hypothetical protein